MSKKTRYVTCAKCSTRSPIESLFLNGPVPTCPSCGITGQLGSNAGPAAANEPVATSAPLYSAAHSLMPFVGAMANLPYGRMVWPGVVVVVFVLFTLPRMFPPMGNDARNRETGENQIGQTYHQARPGAEDLNTSDLTNQDRFVDKASSASPHQVHPGTRDLAETDVSDRDHYIGDPLGASHHQERPGVKDLAKAGITETDRWLAESEKALGNQNNDDNPNEIGQAVATETTIGTGPYASRYRTVWIEDSDNELRIEEGSSGELVVRIGDGSTSDKSESAVVRWQQSTSLGGT